MSRVIALRIKASKKIQNERKKVTMFVGSDWPGTRPFIGLGLYWSEPVLFGDEVNMFCESKTPGSILQAWRALQLLKSVSRINRNSLNYAMEVASYSEISFGAKNYFQSQFKSQEAFEKICLKVLKSVPGQRELDDIIRKLRSNNVPIYKEELLREIEAKVLIPTPLVTNIVQEGLKSPINQDVQAEMQADVSLSEQPKTLTRLRRYFVRSNDS